MGAEREFLPRPSPLPLDAFGKRCGTAPAILRKQRKKIGQRSQKLPDTIGQCRSRPESVGLLPPPSPPIGHFRVCGRRSASPSRSHKLFTLEDRPATSGTSGSARCARRACLCSAPIPPISIARDSNNSSPTESRRRSRLSSGEGEQIESDDPFHMEEQDMGTGSQGSASLRPTPRFSVMHLGSAAHKVEDELRELRTRKAFKSLLQTSASDRISRIDAQRRKTALMKRLQKKWEIKVKRFNALPSHEVLEMRNAFQIHDVDKSGELDSEEVVQCLKEFGLCGMNGEECRNIITICKDATLDIQRVAWADDSEQGLVVSVGLYDFALTVVPRVRQRLTELRSQTLLRQFRTFDVDHTGYVTLEQCEQLSKELGVSSSIFKECLQSQDDECEDQEDPTSNRPQQLKVISFFSFQSAVFAAQERANREDRRKERSIQMATRLDEKLFQEFRHDLLVLHALFERFDVDQSGSLDYEEVEHLLKDFGLFPDDKKERAEVMLIVRSCDDDGSGTFDFNEFLGLVRKIRAFALQSHEERYFCIFERYDRGGRGALNVAELSALLCTLGLVPRTRREQEELAHLILVADEDGSGTLDFTEFSTLCQRIIERMKRLRYEEEISEALTMGFSHEETHELRWIFDRLDTSGNGLIDKCEARNGINMTKIPITHEAFDESFKALDADRSGELDFIEFTHLMRMLRDREGMFKTADDTFSYDDTEMRFYNYD